MRVPIIRTENDPATFLEVLHELERQPYRDPKGRFKPTPKTDERPTANGHTWPCTRFYAAAQGLDVACTCSTAPKPDEGTRDGEGRA